LERTHVDDWRKKALHGDARSAEAWPLSRHSIESYLLDPPFLAQALPVRDEAGWRTTLEEMAEARRWTDLLRATLVDLRWRVSRIDWPSTESTFATREETLDHLASLVARSRAAGEAAHEASVALDKFASLERDFTTDGPLVHRVDGKKLLE